MNMKLFVLFILAFGSEESETVAENGTACGEFDKTNAEKPIFVKIEEDEFVKDIKISSKYIGVNYNKKESKWRARRWSKTEDKMIYNGTFDDEVVAAHASDTLARKLFQIGKQGHRLNFPDDEAEVHKKRTSSKYIGVAYDKNMSTWCVQKWSKNENKKVYNGHYDDEETAAHASDTLARKLMKNGEKGHRLNFPDDETEIHKKKSRFFSEYSGVNYDENKSKWRAGRWSKNEHKMFYDGCYKDEKAAAHASDTLARKLMKNGEKRHRLNFPDDKTEEGQGEHRKKRKRSENLGTFQNK